MRVEVKPYTYTAIPLTPYVEDELGEMAIEALFGRLEWKYGYQTTFESGAALLLDKERVHVAALDIQPCEELGDVTPKQIANWIEAADTRYFIIGVDNIAEPGGR